MRAIRRWRNWHRRIGAAVGVIVLLLAVTGMLLNHGVALKLGQRNLQHPFILSLYGIELPEPRAFSIGKQWLSHWGGSYLYFNEREVGYCEAPLWGAVLWRGQVVAACADAVLILTPEGEVVERLSEHYGVPWPVTGLASDDHLILLTPDGNFRADFDQLQWSLYDSAVVPVSPKVLPAVLVAELQPRLAGAEITYERVIADIHSGRILGDYGVWLADLAAVGLVFLSCSGLWLWWTRR